MTACGGRAVPGPPSAYLGTVLDKPVPDSVAELPLTTDAGRVTSLTALHGHVVVLADFLSLCQETCPLTTGNLLDMGRAVTAAGLGRRLRFAELTVDPGRDTPARLRAYRALVGAPPNWSLLTGRPGVIERIWQYFGVWYQRVAEGGPPGTAWLTGKPLTNDVTHQGVLIYLDASGRSGSWSWARPTPPALPSRLPCGVSSAHRAGRTSATPMRAPGAPPKRSARSPG